MIEFHLEDFDFAIATFSNCYYGILRIDKVRAVLFVKQEDGFDLHIYDKEGIAHSYVATATTVSGAMRLVPFLAFKWLQMHAPMSGHTWPTIMEAVKPPGFPKDYE